MGLLANKLAWIYRAIDLLGNIHMVTEKKKERIYINLYKISLSMNDLLQLYLY